MRCLYASVGSQPSMTKAFEMVFQMIVEDHPQSGSIPTVSYADYSGGPLANANQTGSPFASFGDNVSPRGGPKRNSGGMSHPPVRMEGAMGNRGGPQPYVAVEALKSVLHGAGHSMQVGALKSISAIHRVTKNGTAALQLYA